MSTTLVTGGTGFIGSHCILLLAAGHRVRTTVRDLSRESDVRAMLRAARQILPELGKVKNASHEKAKRLLGWAPRSNEESIVATAESLLRLGLV